MSETYGIVPGDATIPILRTFKEGISSQRDDSYLVIIEGANHFSIADPSDTTTQSNLDLPETRSPSEIRSLLSETIALFIDTYVQKQTETKLKLERLLNNNRAIATFERK